ncbi:MAG: hypothetical protein FWC39_00625 [Bacteroidetes bacterium]|nr:hypothetical protein [Bacteroidota bacterium]
MKKIIVSIFFFVACSFSLMGQNETDTLPKISYHVYINEDTKIEMSRKQFNQFKCNPEWIESIKILKNGKAEKDKRCPECHLGIVVIHIKQEYKQVVLKRLKNNGIKVDL